MRVGSLFSGIGGFDLGLYRAGMDTAWFCFDALGGGVTACRKCGVEVPAGALPSNLCTLCRKKIESAWIDRQLADIEERENPEESHDG